MTDIKRANQYDIDRVERQTNDDDCCDIISESFHKGNYYFLQLSNFGKSILILKFVIAFCWFLASFVGIIVGAAYSQSQICQNIVNITINNTFINSTIPQQYIMDVEEVSQSVNLSMWLISNGAIWLVLMISMSIYIISNKTWSISF